LNVGLDAGGRKEGVAIVVKIAKLTGHIIEEVIPEDHARRETVTDAGHSRADAGIDGAVSIEPVTDFRPNLVLLRKGGGNEENSEEIS